MQIFQNLTTCWVTPARPCVLQVSSPITVHKSVSVHNFKKENIFESLNFRWCRKSLIFASACVPFGSVLSLPRSQPWCVCVDISKHKCHSTAGFLVLSGSQSLREGRNGERGWQPSKLTFFIVVFYFLSALLNPRSSSSLTTQGLKLQMTFVKPTSKSCNWQLIKFTENLPGISP